MRATLFAGTALALLAAALLAGIPASRLDEAGPEPGPPLAAGSPPLVAAQSSMDSVDGTSKPSAPTSGPWSTTHFEPLGDDLVSRGGLPARFSSAGVRIGPEGDGVLLRFPGASLAPLGDQPTGAKSTYALGADPAGWLLDVPHYAAVLYPQAYPGIDMVWYWSDGELEFDLLVSPGADPTVFRLQAPAATVAADGSLAFAGHALRAPVAFQGEHTVAAAWAVEGGLARFELGAYDTSQPLRIDPVVTYSALHGYAGGTGVDGFNGVYHDRIPKMVWVAGFTESSDLPMMPPPQVPAPPKARDAVVFKFDENGNLLYQVFFGGASGDSAFNLAADGNGRVSVVGCTKSTDFPKVGSAWQGTYGGGLTDMFFVQLDGTTNAPIFSSYLGGGGDDGCSNSPSAIRGPDLSLDPATNAVGVAGLTSSSTNMAPLLKDPIDGTKTGADGSKHDGYFAIIETVPAPKLSWGSYWGGDLSDMARAIDITQGLDRVVLVGNAESLAASQIKFPFTCCGSVQGASDAFISVFDLTDFANPSLEMSSLLGGPGNGGDIAFDVAVDGDMAYVAGRAAADFPTTSGAFQESYGGGGGQVKFDGFVAGVDVVKHELVWASYLGGKNDDEVRGVAHLEGQVYLAGSAVSGNLPTTPQASVTKAPNKGGGWDGFVGVVQDDGSKINCLSYVGGLGQDDVQGITPPWTGSTPGLKNRFFTVGFTDSDKVEPITTGPTKTTGNLDGMFMRWDGCQGGDPCDVPVPPPECEKEPTGTASPGFTWEPESGICAGDMVFFEDVTEWSATIDPAEADPDTHLPTKWQYGYNEEPTTSSEHVFPGGGTWRVVMVTHDRFNNPWYASRYVEVCQPLSAAAPASPLPAAGDLDGDGVSNAADNCPGAVNFDQVDLNGDGMGDACAPPAAGAGDAIAVEQEGRKDLPDTDGDGVTDDKDNCPQVPNTDQADLDLDDEGDVCDTDLDGDGVLQVGDVALGKLDNCRFIPNADQRDVDGNGKGDACDLVALSNTPANDADVYGHPTGEVGRDSKPSAWSYAGKVAMGAGLGLVAILAVLLFVRLRRKPDA